MNDRVRRVHCSNGFYEFDSHTTTNNIKIIVCFKEELINEIVDTTIDSIDECMGEYMLKIQPELIGKGEKVYNKLLVKVIEELNKRIK
jgi:hypothetical protein